MKICIEAEDLEKVLEWAWAGINEYSIGEEGDGSETIYQVAKMLEEAKSNEEKAQL